MIVDRVTGAAAPALERAVPVGRRVRPTPLGAVLAVLPVVVVAELLLLRAFYRVGIFIPRDGPFLALYRLSTAAGSFAFNLSSVLVLLALGMLAARAFRAGRTHTAAALAAFGAAALLASVTAAGPVGPTVRLLFILSVVAVVWPFVRSPGPWADRAAVGLAALAALASSYAGLVGDAARLVPSPSGPAGAVAAQLVGEALVVAAAFLFLVGRAQGRGLRVGAVVAGALPALAFVAAWRTNGAVTGILVLWTAGLRLYLPLGLYALALWAYASAGIGWLGDRPSRAGGLVLLLAGGFLLDSTYVQALCLLALVLLTDGHSGGGLPLREGEDVGRAVR